MANGYAAKERIRTLADLHAALKRAQEERDMAQGGFRFQQYLRMRLELEDTKRLGLQVCEQRDTALRDAKAQRALAGWALGTDDPASLCFVCRHPIAEHGDGKPGTSPCYACDDFDKSGHVGVPAVPAEALGGEQSGQEGD